MVTTLVIIAAVAGLWAGLRIKGMKSPADGCPWPGHHREDPL
jgi:hypothetical protein